jgi:penicillin V acylase-like amidase (Ntn superfamily)
MVGNNEDNWGRDPKIWFEQGTKGKFGCVCVGYARKQHPDGAMNEYGLAFDAFTMYRKGNLGEKDPNKKDFAYSHLLTIMQQCKTVDKVYAFFDKLNLHILDGSPIFNGVMFLFVDKTGNYLVIEANKMTLGNDDKFALANFSIADIKDLSTIKL